MQPNAIWLDQNMSKVLGNGKGTKFWADKWVGEANLAAKYMRLHRLSAQKHCCINDMGKWDAGVWSWSFNWSRGLLEREQLWVGELLADLGNAQPRENVEDKWCWGGNVEGIFTVKSAYVQIQNLLEDEGMEVYELLWKIPAPFNVLGFIWKALRGRIQTRANLRKRNVLQTGTETNCPFCGLHEETTEHVLLSCEFSYGMWRKCYRWLGQGIVLLNDCRAHFLQHGSVGWNQKHKRGAWIIWVAVCWSLWLHRNEIIFRGATLDAGKLFDLIQFRSWSWLTAKYGSFQASMCDWITNPSCCLLYL